nr:immunoglobulin light chain junction region [Macaca mulatta]MOW63919.1 immunoglobulin light chain junction region [Macaca mulatta]MOW65580.1 immunoglobulin light chain junction region [Macaca mulatta]
CGQGTHIPPTF